MSQPESGSAMSRETALALCAEIRSRYRGKWWTLAGMQCMGCVAASKGDPAKMCVGSRADNRGCNLVNARHARQLKGKGRA